ncbi:hypothetical protein PV10_00001 [Exophiala mesophila]|uniref:Transcription factor domain-containing protein n=1 Tax=Exophiala mesophila TaxID=212818 RepID=A0A0D1ZNB0_EXOME|nr:uncharacterized protein PV10_00001 [Exophiala mesophila]KIV96097.1 hypothetical protein PV10_00001 [Exophiala mesophila]
MTTGSRFSDGQFLDSSIVIESPPPPSPQVCRGFLHFTTKTMDFYYRHLMPTGSRTDTVEDEDSDMISTQSLRIEYSSLHEVDGFQASNDKPNPTNFGTIYFNPGNRSETESLLIDFFINTIQQDKLYFLLDQGQNPVTYMLMASCTSPTIYAAILMFTADRLAQLDSKFSHVVMRYRQRTLKALRDLLIQWNGSMRDILLVSMMLCVVEINEPHPGSWVVHFSAYRHAIQQRLARTTRHQAEDYGYNLAYRFFTHHLIMAKTMFNVDEANGGFIASSNDGSSVDGLPPRWTSTENLALEMDSDSLQIIDPYSNFSNGLLLLVNEVADLKRLQSSTHRLKHLRDRRKMEAHLQTKMQQLKASLASLTQVAPEWMKESEPESVVALIEQVAEANRLAALVLLLHEPYLPLNQHNAASANQGDSPNHDILASTSDNAIPAACRREEKEQYLKNLLQLVDSFIASTCLLAPSWALWSTFIAGCCTEKEDNRVTVMGIFNTAIRMTQRSNIVSAFRVLQAVWRQRDLQADVTDVCVRTISRRRKHEKEARSGKKAPSSSSTPPEYIYEWQSVMDMIGERISPF